MKIYLVSFGTTNYIQSLNRLKKEAIESNFFDEIVIYTENDIPGFMERHNYFIQNCFKGFGCWIWKSYAVFKALQKLEEGDIIMYLDAGCSINKEGKDRFNEYINLCINSQFKNVSFQYKEYMENQYTKQDVINYYNLNENDCSSGQLIGGIFMLQKCSFTQALIEKWMYDSWKYDLINDKIKIKNDVLISHRHDQSLFSCIRKQLGTHSIENESDLGGSKLEEYKNIEVFRSYPFWATRIRN
jgi:hypothetical protein